MQKRGKMAQFGRASRAFIGWLIALSLLITPAPLIAQSPTQQPDQTLYLPSVATTESNVVPPNPTQPVATLSDEERIEIITNVESAVNDILPPVGTHIDERDLIAETELLGQELLKIPGIITTITMTEVQTVQVVMADGLSILIVNNRPILPPPTDPETQVAFAEEMHTPTNAQQVDLQQSFVQQVSSPQANTGNRRAVVTSYDGGASVAAEVTGQLIEAGYEVLGLTASLTDMMQYKNLGLLYLDTHSALFQHFSVNIDAQGNKSLAPGEKEYSIQTSTILNISDITKYKQQLDSGELTILIGEEPAGRPVKFAITSKFIRKYWSFNDGFVLLHICYGGRPAFTLDGQCQGQCQNIKGQVVLDPPLLRNAMKAVGAKAIVSFDGESNAEYARLNFRFMFDRLLGQNRVMVPIPPMRPFDITQVRGDMQQNNLLSFLVRKYSGTDLFGTTINFTFDLDDPQISIAPSIQRITVLDDPAQEQGELKIAGNFPTSQGMVTIDDFPTTIKSWSKSEIVVNTSAFGNGAAGSLRVLGPVANGEGVKSNPVPLTLWIGTIKFIHKLGLGNLQATTENTVSFRADLHASRSTLESTPTQEVQEVYLNSESPGHIVAQGQYNTEEGSITWTGGGELKTLGKAQVDVFASTPIVATTANANQGEGLFGGMITIDPKNKKATLCFIVQGNYEAIYQTQEATIPTPMSISSGALPLGDTQRGMLDCVNTTMKNDYTIAGGHRTYTVDQVSYRIEWSDFISISPPNEETPG